jgi:N-formylglutamate deformylase
MSNLIIHIPHSSDVIPSYDGFIAEECLIRKEINKLTDWYTQELFDHGKIVKADFSRVFCDVERFENDDEEPMAKYGMGVTYTTTDCGQPLRDLSSEQREEILKNFYRPHHRKLSDAVAEDLSKNQSASILDAHSFSNIPFIRDMDKSPGRPDFCIGTDVFHTPLTWIHKAIDFFHHHGYSLGIDRPYKGTIVPLDFYGKDQRVKSIMLEVNRSLYMNEDTLEKKAEFGKIRSVIRDFIVEVMDEPVGLIN